MSLRTWIASFSVPNVATPATTATASAERGQLSQVSQLSQGVGAEREEHEAPQVSQLSQPVGTSGARADTDAAREVFEERAAIIEYDGGLTRAAAERAARITEIGRNSEPRVAAELFPPRRWLFEEWDDLRPCLLCRNLARSGRCLAAWRGELRAARDWEPTFPGQPQRCIGYDPKADDPDQRPGRERWPEMVEWQAPIGTGK